MTVTDTFNNYVATVLACNAAAQEAAAEQFAAWAVNQARTDPVLAGLMVLFIDDLLVHPNPAFNLLGARLAQGIAPLAAPALPALEAVFGNPSNPEAQAAALLGLIAHQHPQSVDFVLIAWGNPVEALKIAALEGVALYNFLHGGAPTLFGLFISQVINDPDCRYQALALAQQLEFLTGV